MDISRISEFLSYKPYLEDDCDSLADKIFSQFNYLKPQELKQLYNAYRYAKALHKKAFRLSGEKYIVHPLRVVDFLYPLRPDLETLQAALMHDLIEDTDVTKNDIAQQFGDEVAWLCEGLVKVSTVRRSGEERQLETLKKTFLAMGKDLRVIFIKIADRVHNIQTLHFHPTLEKRKRIANETLKIYVPIAKRLGLYVFQGFLENGSFAQLDPQEYKRIVSYVSKYYSGGENYKNIGVQRLEWLCKEEGIQFESLIGRVKSPYRIWRKLQKYQSKDISKIMDIVAFRIITDKVSECYTMLGIIHKHYTPIFAKMKDYIAIPKPNGYKSLHTTILGMFDFPVEIQVRTQKMDEVANYGVAAHFAYSEEEAATNPHVSQEQQEWIERLQDIVKKYRESTNKEDFKQELNIELLHKTIFIYTPKGDIIELPSNSTVLDFAFRVHTDVGLKFRNAHVNGKIVPIDYLLKTGDIVSISTFNSKITANKGRYEYVKTPSSKTKLAKYLRNLEKETIFRQVENKINEKLKSYELPLLHSKSDRITKAYQGGDYESVLYKIYDGQVRVTKLLREIYTDQMKQIDSVIIDKQEEVLDTVIHSSQKVIVDGHELANIIECPECTPEIGQQIIARSGQDGIKLHRVICSSINKIKPKKFLEAHWTGYSRKSYCVQFSVNSKQKPGVLLHLLRIVERFNKNIESLHTKKINDTTQIIIFTVHFSNPSTIGFITERITEKSMFHSVSIEFIEQKIK